MRARGRDGAHPGEVEEEKFTEAVDELPMVQMAYTFLEGPSATNETYVTILDLCVSTVRCGAGTIVEKKGPVKFAAQWALKKLDQFGLSDAKIRTDSERSIVALAQGQEASHAQDLVGRRAGS